jgi:hypothetical protein
MQWGSVPAIHRLQERLSPRSEVLYNSLMRVDGLIKVCSSEVYSKAWRDKHLSVTLPEWF